MSDSFKIDIKMYWNRKTVLWRGKNLISGAFVFHKHNFRIVCWVGLYLEWVSVSGWGAQRQGCQVAVLVNLSKCFNDFFNRFLCNCFQVMSSIQVLFRSIPRRSFLSVRANMINQEIDWTINKSQKPINWLCLLLLFQMINLKRKCICSA